MLVGRKALQTKALAETSAHRGCLLVGLMEHIATNCVVKTDCQQPWINGNRALEVSVCDNKSEMGSDSPA
jgi:hypothetical protein